MKKRPWLTGIALLLAFLGLAYWAMSYAAMRAGLSKELSLFNQVHNAVMVYHMDTRSFPRSLEDPGLQRYFEGINDAEWAFLRRQGLSYTPPNPESDPAAIILRIFKSCSSRAARMLS